MYFLVVMYIMNKGPFPVQVSCDRLMGGGGFSQKITIDHKGGRGGQGKDHLIMITSTRVAEVDMTGLFYGVSIPDTEDLASSQVEVKPSYADKAEVMKVLKEFKTARFKMFKTEEEAAQFSQSSTPTTSTPDLVTISSPRPSESCTFRSLTPQEEVKFRKAIEANPSDLEFVVKCVESNPRYLVTASDTPTILQAGQRHNALHVSARHGKEEAGQLVLNHVMGDLMARMYPGEGVEQNNRRREHLVDMYLNMPDKGGGETPLHLASKFGNFEMVKLLCGQHMTRLEVANKHGEIPRDIVCSRVGDKGVKEDILAMLKGQLVIPVYRTEEVRQLGKPISLKEAAELLESSGELSFTSISSTNSPLNSPLGRSPLANSPMLHSPLGHSPLARSPLVTGRTRLSASSPVPVSPLVTISAVLGPIPPAQADILYKEWRAGKRERLDDPQLGVERQGRGLAGREGVQWSEFWHWLGGYMDLASKEGLEVLETYLGERNREITVELERKRCGELEEEVLDSTVGLVRGVGDGDHDDVFSDEIGELELAVVLPSSTPAKTSDWSRYRDTGQEDNSYNETGHDNTMDTNGNVTSDPNDNTTDPLSPLSSLANGLGGLNLVNCNASLVNQTAINTTETTPPTVLAHSLSGSVVSSLAQFCSVVVPTLCDSLPELDPAVLGQAELADWVGGVVSHWAVLRRQVNNWRSDPQDRYMGLDWGQLAVRLVEMMGDQVTMELGTGLERERCGLMLERVAQIRTGGCTGVVGAQGVGGDFNRTREVARSSSVVDLSGVREIQRLAGLVSTFLLRDSLPSNNIGSVWDLETEKEWVRTSNVNRARRFLHSSEGSAVGGVEGEDFSDINKGAKPEGNQPHQKGDLTHQSAARRLSVGSQASQEWGTPPSSPAESIASSMETCSEGVVAYVAGVRPTQQDRRVMEALEKIPEDRLARYPAVQWYLTHIRSFSKKERLAWEVEEDRADQTSGLARKLDLDLTY